MTKELSMYKSVLLFTSLTLSVLASERVIEGIRFRGTDLNLEKYAIAAESLKIVRKKIIKFRESYNKKYITYQELQAKEKKRYSVFLETQKLRQTLTLIPIQIKGELTRKKFF